MIEALTLILAIFAFVISWLATGVLSIIITSIYDARRSGTSFRLIDTYRINSVDEESSKVIFTIAGPFGLVLVIILVPAFIITDRISVKMDQLEFPRLAKLIDKVLNYEIVKQRTDKAS